MRVRKYNWLAALAAIVILVGWEAPKAAASQVVGSNTAANKTSAPQKDSKKGQDAQNADSAEADKVLYEKAMNDIKHARYDTARLSLETLINTYPDSEYLAKAKLAIGDSYYEEGGATGLTQAVSVYQDFITFFPFLEEASYAQMQIAMAHYRRMEKADRDRSEALEAEAAFQTFIQKYPNTELTPKAEQRLREVQEVLADGDFRIATFYYLRRVDKAAAPRLIDLVNRYPLYSASDRANWMLGTIYERNEHNDMAATYYTRLVKQYPLSPLAAEAKTKLAKFGDPVPQPDPTAMARMQQEQRTPRDRPMFLKRPTEILKSGPNVSTAARVGMPMLTPQSDDATDTLTPGAGLTVVASGGASTGSTGGSGTYVQTVTPVGSGVGDPAVPTSVAGASNAAAGASAQGSQAAATPAESGQSASGDPTAQSSQPANTGESSSNKKKKKSKKPGPVQAQPQAQPQPAAQPQDQAAPQSQPQ
jgi:outer membrane protein assembly factor BamD